jgi:hypothetical protein
MDRWQDQFDEALENALIRYGQVPEREGLERRILERVAEGTARTTRIRSLTLALCATTAAVCCLFWWQMPRTTVQIRPAKMVVPEMAKSEMPKLQISARDHEVVLSSATKLRRTPKKPGEPKLSRFPKPIPVSSEDRALLRLVMHGTKDISPELISIGGPIKPIEITELEIKPL